MEPSGLLADALEGEPEDAEPTEPLVDEVPPIEVNLAAAGPLLAKKGKAKAAPPTDPEAINHLVTGQSEPEPFEEEVKELKGRAAPVPEVAPEEPADMGPVEGPLTGKHFIFTALQSLEPIDPVRYIAIL
jgi:phosphopantothenoylcysteine decarboxylase/phosphopantothenate--cysteine ligase